MVGQWRIPFLGLTTMSVFAYIACFGCGGGGGASSTSGGQNGTSSAPDGVSARFHVDVRTGQVTIIPSKSDSKTLKSRAVFSGTAVAFNSSVLVDQPDQVGIKTLSVSITNNWGLPIGQDPNGNVTGLRVLFSPISNITTFPDPRAQTTVSTLAGTGIAGETDGAYSAATFNNPGQIAVGSDGSAYVAEYQGNKIRKVAAGRVSTLAGSGTTADVDGSGGAASFAHPWGIAQNPTDGALIVADVQGNKIRRVTLDGRVTTVAGTGTAGSSDGSGSSATFTTPTGVAVDSSGTIYVADHACQIRKIVFTGGDPRSASNYTVSTFAGSTTGGNQDGVGTSARFSQIWQLTADPTGNLYVADKGNNTIRFVSPTGEVVTIAGTGNVGESSGSGATATFTQPSGIAYLNGAVFVSDYAGNEVREMVLATGAPPSVATSWSVVAIAGNGTPGSFDGNGSNAEFNGPSGLAVTSGGNLLVAASAENRIRLVTANNGVFPIGIPTGSTGIDPVQLSNASGVVPIAAGGSLSYISYPGAVAAGQSSAAKYWSFSVPTGVNAFEFTVTVEADSAVPTPPNSAVGAGSPKVTVRTLTGFNLAGFLNGNLATARFNGPEILAMDAAGDIYASDNFNNAIRRISASGVVSTVAGATSGAFADGSGRTATFSSPEGIAVTPDGNTLYVADLSDHRIRRISFTGGDITDPSNWLVATIAGTGAQGGNYSTPTAGNVATMNYPTGLALDPGGNIYFAEVQGNRIRRMQFLGGDTNNAANWTVYLIAGDASAVSGASGDVDGSFSSARFYSPDMIACDSSGRVYVADSANHRVRVVTSDGTVTTLAGGVSGDTPQFGYQDGAGATARFSTPTGVAVDSSGLVYVAESSGNRIRCITQAGNVTTVAGTGASGATDGPGNVATFYNPFALLVSPGGTLYVGSTNDNSIRMIQRNVSVGTH